MADWKNDGRIRLLIIVGTRPEIIRLSEVIKKCRRYFDTILAHTGQNYDYTLNGIFFKDLGLDDPDVYMDAVGDDLGATMGNIIDKSYKLMVELKPDALLVLGDTNSCLSAISAKRLHIPIFHMEAGNRCKDECLPEETNRRIVDIISDVNLAYSEHARRYLAECGLPKERTYVTGSPMAEVLDANIDAIQRSDIHKRLSGEFNNIHHDDVWTEEGTVVDYTAGDTADGSTWTYAVRPGEYILLSAHREENIDTDENFLSLFTAINEMARKYDMPILYSCHPRSKKKLDEMAQPGGVSEELARRYGVISDSDHEAVDGSTGNYGVMADMSFHLDPRVIAHEPLGFHDYNRLQMDAFCVVSDSGTLPEESSYFLSIGHPFPAVCIRTSTERPEALDKGCFILSGIDTKGLLQSVDLAVEMVKNKDLGMPVPDYMDKNVSDKVVRLIQSYVGVVDKMVWRKN